MSALDAGVRQSKPCQHRPESDKWFRASGLGDAFAGVSLQIEFESIQKLSSENKKVNSIAFSLLIQLERESPI